MGARVEKVEEIIDVRIELEACVPAAAGVGGPRGAHVHDQLGVVGQQLIRSNADKGPVLSIGITIMLRSFTTQSSAELPQV